MLNAADTRYSEWTGSRTVADVDGLVERLNKLIDNAERQHAADPRFLERCAMRSEAMPSQNPFFIAEELRDGNFTRNPTWSFASGKFNVERSGGMRTTVPLPKSSQSGEQDTATAILDALLGGSGKAATMRAPDHDRRQDRRQLRRDHHARNRSPRPDASISSVSATTARPAIG